MADLVYANNVHSAENIVSASKSMANNLNLWIIRHSLCLGLYYSCLRSSLRFYLHVYPYNIQHNSKLLSIHNWMPEQQTFNVDFSNKIFFAVEAIQII